MRSFRIVAGVLALAALTLAGCNRQPSPDPTAPGPAPTPETPVAVDRDEHSYAQPERVVIDDLALDLDLDFDTRTLAGTATYALAWRDAAAGALVLDTRDLAIERVEGERDGRWHALDFALDDAHATLGSRLTVQVPERDARVRVTYRTSPEASGLQWLTPEMTEGRILPFMFSQSQQIHARSWVPLQDTPAVRYTYTARVRTRPDVMVLMSADNAPDAQRDGSYEFSMPQRIPSYLMAIAAGDLVFAPISDRAGVWAEPTMVERAVAEFADTERMIETTEQLYGPYRWERYDLLVLPPSFPYGGMENPRLSFITPTVIVGDKSLVSLIAHELAHSWSGNLVTFASPKHGWLNEGVTSYVENRIVEALFGKAFSDMEYVIARDALESAIDGMSAPEQALALRPGTEIGPDDPLSGVVYDKGAWFLHFLEERFGRETFDPFLRGYFDHFAFQSITTEQFVDYAREHLLAPNPGTVTDEELDAWIYGTGIPESAPRVLSPRLGLVDSARLAWLGSAQLPPQQLTGEWTTQEWIHFLEGMPQTLSLEQMAQLDTAYQFTGTPNGELAMRWYPLAVRSAYMLAFEPMTEFLRTVGRMKLVMPVYTALAQTPEGLALAREVFAQARPTYHPITAVAVQRILDAAPSAAPPEAAAPAAPGTGDAPAGETADAA